MMKPIAFALIACALERGTICVVLHDHFDNCIKISTYDLFASVSAFRHPGESQFIANERTNLDGNAGQV